MFSKNQSKYIRSLAQQKYRKEYQSYVAEGDKIVKEWLLSKEKITIIAATAAWLYENEAIVQLHREAEVITVSETELENISSLKTPNKALAVVCLPLAHKMLPDEGWIIAADTIQDPGNLGTIIRIADWFGVQHIVASADTVDFYNPKVIQAAMGGHLRVVLHTASLKDFLGGSNLPVYAALLNGENIYELNQPSPGIILLGNESKGVHPSLINAQTQKITIPRRGGAESLNVAVSAGIICSLLIR